VANRERDKGLRGEREVAAIWREYGFDVRGLEGEGDHAISIGYRGEASGAHYPVLHSEVKRQETARPWAWIAQAEAEAPAGAAPVVAFRRSRSKWYALIGLEDLARLLA
jgi:hypothetical protein